MKTKQNRNELARQARDSGLQSRSDEQRSETENSSTAQAPRILPYVNFADAATRRTAIQPTLF